MRLFIFGAGYSGKAIAREMAGRAEWIGGTARSAEKLAVLAETEIEPFPFDGEQLPASTAKPLEESTHLLVSIAPDDARDPVLRVAKDIIVEKMLALRWIGYLSTVGVYGNHDGRWVDEETPCRPVSTRSVQRLAAEQGWRGLGEEIDLPVAIFRLSGIYGPGRNAFVNIESGAAKRIVKPGQVFNRIHVEDIAGATALLAAGETSGLFNITDDEPAPPQDVVAYAARLMGVEPPPEIPFADAGLSPMARSFYGENKRVSNAGIKSLGYRFRHPNYRVALDAMWRSGNWRDG